MDSWERFNEVSLPDKKPFYRELILDDISDEDYIHAQKVAEEFRLKYLDEYYDLYLQSDVLFLADVFEKFREMCLEFYELDPTKFISAPGLAWQTALKKNQVKMDLLTDIAMLLIVEKDIRGGICNAVYQYAKANNIYMEEYGENKEPSYIQYWHVKIVSMDEQCPKNFQHFILNGLKIFRNLTNFS